MRALLLILLLATSAWAGPLEDEAKRQLDFAQTELDGGAYDKAIKSAQSAYRLDPTAYRALVVLGLAYEGLGDLDRARSFLETCTTLASGTAVAQDAGVALERVKAALEEQRGPRRATKAKGKGKQTLADQIAEALADKRCKDAADLAEGWTDKKPQEAVAWERLGEALACLADEREAVRAYRRAKELGSTSNTLPLMIKGLEADLASLTLTLKWPDEARKIEPRLLIIGMDPVAPDEGTTWTDLPPGPVQLFFGGAGFGPAVDVGSLEAGRTAEVALDVPWLGLGTLQVGKGTDVTVVAVVGGEEKPLTPGRAVDVTAGPVTLLVHGAEGTVEQSIVVTAGETVTFEPKVFAPTTLTVQNVPTGSTVRLFLEGADGVAIERMVEVPKGVGVMNNDAGVPLAAEVVFPDAIAGSGGVFVLHPLLGEGAAEVDVIEGDTNVLAFDWEAMPGVSAIRTQYEFFQADGIKGPEAVDGGVVAAAIVSLGLAAGAGALLGASFAEEAGVPGKHEVYRATALTGDAASTQAAYDEWNGARVRVEQLRWASVGVGSGAVVGLGITVVAGATGKARLKGPEWAPDGF